MNTEGCIVKTIFLLKSFTKMKCLAPIGLRRDLASFKHHDYRTMKTVIYVYIYQWSLHTDFFPEVTFKNAYLGFNNNLLQDISKYLA